MWQSLAVGEPLLLLIKPLLRNGTVAQLLTKPLPANAPQFYTSSNLSTLHMSQGRCEGMAGPQQLHTFLEFR
jgi:hypothetical protein